jgi:hypothetical protein
MLSFPAGELTDEQHEREDREYCQQEEAPQGSLLPSGPRSMETEVAPLVVAVLELDVCHDLPFGLSQV